LLGKPECIASGWAGQKAGFAHNFAHNHELLLTERVPTSRLANMEVHFKPETESRLQELASQSGRPTDELVEDAMAAYLSEVAEVRALLDGRYDDIKNSRVKPVVLRNER